MSNPRVLLIEDEALVAMMMEDTLADWGWDVTATFSSVGPALEWLADNPRAVDCAVLDINLGGEMVYPVAETLKAQETPFLFLTGYTAAPQAAEYNAPILYKPFDHDALERTLDQWKRAA